MERKRQRGENRLRQLLVVVLVYGLSALVLPGAASARPLPSPFNAPRRPVQFAKPGAVEPVYHARAQFAGRLWLAVTNYGLLGTESEDRIDFSDKVRLRIDYSPSLEFPAGTRNEYLYAGGLWVGGIVGADTLVSMAVTPLSNSELGEFASYDSLIELSSIPGTPAYDPSARAEQVYVARYADTGVAGGVDPVDNRRHRPLGLEITQRSYAWSDPFARQFVIIEYWIRNISGNPIQRLACGLYFDPDILNSENGDPQLGTIDDVSGFSALGTSPVNETWRDPINAAWFADNDGDPLAGTYPIAAPNAAIGVRLLRTPPVERLSFNWWVGQTTSGWGPVRANARPPSLYGGLGFPQGDRSAYYLMTNGERDYSQYVANIDYSAQGWRPPSTRGACDIADGGDTRQILSAGPACAPLMPGDSVPFVFAVFGGNSIHPPADYPYSCTYSDAYLAALDLSDFYVSAIWAGWVYDTPGVDSDGDKYAGEARQSDGGSQYYAGDLGPPPGYGPPCVDYGGAPDFAGPTGPPCPQPGTSLTVETKPGEVILRWDGRRSETTPDPVAHTIDFEGYRVYASRFNSPGQYSLVASWDSENYRRFTKRGPRWNLDGGVITGDSLRALYGAEFDPTLYNVPSVELAWRDTIDLNGFRVQRLSYFEKVGQNNSNTYRDNGLLVTNIIQRVGDSTVIEDVDTLRFGLYEAHLVQLNPAEPVYVSVTAFDGGHPLLKVDPLESLPGSCSEYVIPIYSASIVEDSGLRVSVYPNPYKISYRGNDGRRTSYFDEGYEAPEKRATGANFEEQDRRVWFVNLPAKATIRIYSLDGDLIRTIDHEWPRPEEGAYLTDYSSRTAWDLVSRNTQAIVSGIYIYHIESPQGTQTGKIVIIK